MSYFEFLSQLHEVWWCQQPIIVNRLTLVMMKIGRCYLFLCRHGKAYCCVISTQWVLINLARLEKTHKESPTIWCRSLLRLLLAEGNIWQFMEMIMTHLMAQVNYYTQEFFIFFCVSSVVGPHHHHHHNLNYFSSNRHMWLAFPHEPQPPCNEWPVQT